MAVRIRLKKMGRTHRPFYRVCAFDHNAPRDGRAIEELGTYDTSVADTDARAILKSDRIDYWLSVGAKPSEKVAVLIKKYGTNGTHLEQHKTALEKIAGPKTMPDLGAPAPPKKEEEPPVEEAAPADDAETSAEAPAEVKTEDAPSEEASKEENKEE